MVTAVTSLREWNRTLLFDQAGDVLHSSFSLTVDELQQLMHAWDDRDSTVGSGFKLDGHEFEVHRYCIFRENHHISCSWYNSLIYGRADGGEGDGFALHRVCDD